MGLFNVWRRGWASNPRLRFPNTSFPRLVLKPLRHLSATHPRYISRNGEGWLEAQPGNRILRDPDGATRPAVEEDWNCLSSLLRFAKAAEIFRNGVLVASGHRKRIAGANLAGLLVVDFAAQL